jgi:undecaprenyl diphosphate synthase
MEKVQLTKPLYHVAFIMDGNGRWAKEQGLPRYLGHKKACERIIDIFHACLEHHIKVMSLYAFSTENWSRPKSEINHLFKYLEQFFNREMDHLMSHGARIIISGDITPLPDRTKKVINAAIERSKDNDNIVMNICLNYGGKAEIVRACQEITQEIKENNLDVSQINEQMFENHLYTKGLPNVDLLIRTSGEYRISNFLLWQLAYAEMEFPKTYWPDFTPEEFEKCLKEYEHRHRRFGGLKNE